MKNSISIKGDNNGTTIIASGNVTVQKGVPPELFAQKVTELALNEATVNSFFITLLEQKVPRDQWDNKLRKIAGHYKELLVRLETVQSADPEVVRLKQEARQAVEAGDYAKAEELLENVAKQYSISAARTYVELAKLQEVQLRYAKAAKYWQKASALLPKESKKERAYYLNTAGYDLDRISRYNDALPLYEQSLSISQEIGDRVEEGTTLNNISQIYKARGDYDTALKYLEQSLSISQEIGNRAGEGARP